MSDFDVMGFRITRERFGRGDLGPARHEVTAERWGDGPTPRPGDTLTLDVPLMGQRACVVDSVDFEHFGVDGQRVTLRCRLTSGDVTTSPNPMTSGDA